MKMIMDGHLYKLPLSREGEVVEVLLKNGANINEKNASGKMPDYQIDWQIID